MLKLLRDANNRQGEKFNEADAQSPLGVASDQERDDDSVHGSSDTPRDGFNETAIVFFCHVIN